jgi:hypothetical protein
MNRTSGMAYCLAKPCFSVRCDLLNLPTTRNASRNLSHLQRLRLSTSCNVGEFGHRRPQPVAVRDFHDEWFLAHCLCRTCLKLRDVLPVSITHEIIEIVQQSRGPSRRINHVDGFPGQYSSAKPSMSLPSKASNVLRGRIL